MHLRRDAFALLACTLAACFNPNSDEDTDAAGTGTTAATGTNGTPDDGTVGPGSDTGGPGSTDGPTMGGMSTAGVDDTTTGDATTRGSMTDDSTDDSTDGGDATTTGAADGWQARRQLTFVGTVLDDGLTDFPLLVQLNSSRIEYEIMQPDGADLRFYDRNEVPLAYEIERWDPSGDSFVWVRVLEIDANDDHIFMDYGNPAAEDAQDPPGVWEGAYEAVWHLADDPTTGVIMDSTGNGHDGTLPVGSDASSAAARVGPGIVMDGDDLITVPDAAGLNLSDHVTLEAWANPTSLAGSQIGIVERSFYYSLEAVRFFENPGGVGIRTGGLTQGVGLASDLATSTWTHLSGTYEVDDAIRLIVDGALFDSTTVGAAAIPGNATDITIGDGFSGTLDEVRIVGVEHSPTWIAAQYESMTDQLLTFGPVIDPPR